MVPKGSGFQLSSARGLLACRAPLPLRRDVKWPDADRVAPSFPYGLRAKFVAVVGK